MRIRSYSVSSLLIVASLALTPPAVSAANAPFNISPTKPVDERLFLVQALAQMYEKCLGDAQNTEAFNKDVSVYRPIASRLLRHIYNQNLGDRLATLYRGYLKNMDSLKNYDERIAANMSEADAARSDAQGELFLQNFGTGFAAVGMANAHPVVAIGSTIYGLYSAWKAEEQSNQQISDSERAAIDAARRNLRDNLEPSLMHAQALVNNLASQYGWTIASMGFDVGRASVNQSVENQTKKYDPLYRLSCERSKLRQIIRIVRMGRGTNATFFAPKGLALSLLVTGQCLQVTRTIPQGHVYDYFCYQSLYAAAVAGLSARICEVDMGIKPLGSTPISRMDVGLWRMVSQYNPSELNRTLFTCALIDDNSLNAALREASKLTGPLGGDPDFCYDYACLCSRVGSFNNAMGWLTNAVANGYWHSGSAYTDPNLAALKQAHPNQFHNLLYPSAAYTFNLGQFIGDDAVLTNNSRFAITNVALTITTSNGARLTLTVPEIPAGGTKTWTDCANPGVLKGSTARYTCDQLERINNARHHAKLAKKNDIEKNRIITGAGGHLHPAPGYCWVLPNDRSNFRVISGADACLVGLELMNIGSRYSTDPAAQTADYNDALSWYRKAAAAGNADAMNNIGVGYEHGQGVPQDYARAMKWFRKAAAEGNEDAMGEIGVLYSNRQRVPQDYAKAMARSAMALERYGSATAGSGLAMYNIGLLYVNGQGVPQDYARAMKWFRKGATAGNGGAMYSIGWLYANAHGVPQDYAKAAAWFRKAEQSGGPQTVALAEKAIKALPTGN